MFSFSNKPEPALQVSLEPTSETSDNNVKGIKSVVPRFVKRFLIAVLAVLVIFLIVLASYVINWFYEAEKAPYRYDASAESVARQSDEVNQLIDRGAYGDQAVRRVEYMRIVVCDDFLIWHVNCRVDSVVHHVDNEQGLQPVEPVWRDYGSDSQIVKSDALRLPDREFVTTDWEPGSDAVNVYPKLVGVLILKTHGNVKQPSATERAIAKQKANEEMPRINRGWQDMDGTSNNEALPKVHVEPKDPSDNDKQQKDARGFEDNASVSDSGRDNGL